MLDCQVGDGPILNVVDKILKEKVTKVCIDMKEALRKVAEVLLSRAKVVTYPFNVVADFNKRMIKGRRTEQDTQKKLAEERVRKPDRLLGKYPSLKGFY